MRPASTVVHAALLLLTACGGGGGAAGQRTVAPAAATAPAVTATPAPATPATRTESRADAPLVITYVPIDRSWVEKHLPPTAAPAKAWAADPENARFVVPTSRHVLVKVAEDAPAPQQAAARKKAEAVLARLQRGEDFAKVAREVSDDPGSKDKGGAYPGEMVEQFVEPYRAAYAALAPGQMTKQLVRSQFGWHVIKKDLADEAAILAGFRRATALQLARRLAGDLAERLRPAGAEAHTTRAVSASVAELLGAVAAEDQVGPGIRLVPVDKVASPPPTPTCAKLIATARGTVTILTLEEDAGYVVGKAGADTETDKAAPPTATFDADGAPLTYCRSASDTKGALTPAQIRKMIEDAQKKQRGK